MENPVITSPEPYAWMVYVNDRDVDYLIFWNRSDAVDQCLHEIENSEQSVDSWDLWPLYRAQAEQIAFD